MTVVDPTKHLTPGLGPEGMGEHAAVEAVDDPVTVDRIAADLRELGVAAGDTLLVHSSLSELGWVAGGPQAVVDALQQVVTTDGTIVMPTHSTQYSDPSLWMNPPVPDDWVPRIRESMPAFRPAVTPSRGMGAVAECFRDYPEAVRSRHPLYSFAAWGSDAEAIVAEHSFENAMGENSPLARVYERDGTVLLLGTGHASNTSLHLAEYRADLDLGERETGSAVLVDGDREWVEYADVDFDDGDFAECGAAFERDHTDAVDRATIGTADVTRASQRALVDHAVDWLAANRD